MLCLDNDLNKVDRFIEIYNQNMKYLGAESIYFYDKDYFYALTKNSRNVIKHFYVELDGEYICGGLFSALNEIIQYHLSGTADSARKISYSFNASGVSIKFKWF